MYENPRINTPTHTYTHTPCTKNSKSTQRVHTELTQSWHRINNKSTQSQHKVNTKSTQSQHRVNTESTQSQHRVNTESTQSQHRPRAEEIRLKIITTPTISNKFSLESPYISNTFSRFQSRFLVSKRSPQHSKDLPGNWVDLEIHIF